MISFNYKQSFNTLLSMRFSRNQKMRVIRKLITLEKITVILSMFSVAILQLECTNSIFKSQIKIAIPFIYTNIANEHQVIEQKFCSGNIAFNTANASIIRKPLNLVPSVALHNKLVLLSVSS